MSALVLRADARRLPLADESVDLIVTSPPYYNQRDYGDTRQIGREATEADYLQSLGEAMGECARVVKRTGVAWINLGDKRRADRSKMLLPHRFAIDCAAAGWTVVQDQVWAKTTTLDNKAVHRTRDQHEFWFMLTRSRDCFADIDAVREPYADHSLYCAEVEDRLGYERSRTNPDRVDGGRPKSKIHPLGRVPGSVWTVASDGFDAPEHLDVDHFAAFPIEWPRRLILGWSPSDGVVLDPFGGTGTTAMVARALGRRGISVDTGESNCALARWRIFESGHNAKVESRTNSERQGLLL